MLSKHRVVSVLDRDLVFSLIILFVSRQELIVSDDACDNELRLHQKVASRGLPISWTS